MIPEPAFDGGDCADGAECQLCGDMAVPVRLESIDHSTCTGRGTHEGRAIEVALDLLATVSVGDVVMVHQGFAIERVSA